MRTKRNPIYALAMILTVSILPLMSCKSLPETEQTRIEIKTEFPNPYDKDGKPIVTLETDGSVKMPLWYWLKITDYVIDVEANKELQR